VCQGCSKLSTTCRYVTDSDETHAQALKRKYDQLQAGHSPFQEIFQLLRTLPELETQSLVAKIRSGADADSIIRTVRAGNLLMQLRLLPEMRFRYELPHNPEIPATLLPDNPYLGSYIYEAKSLLPTPAWEARPPRLDRPVVPYHSGPYVKPLNAAEVVDPCLASARPSAWTSVCNDDVLMRRLLSTYLRCEYHVTMAFQKDLFLEDMEAGRDEFCSPLLVNTVLAYACVSAVTKAPPPL